MYPINVLPVFSRQLQAPTPHVQLQMLKLDTLNLVTSQMCILYILHTEISFYIDALD